MSEELKSILIRELKETVSTEIQRTVNGKIDSLKKDAEHIKNHLAEQDKILISLDERIKPFEETVGWFSKFKAGVVWLAGLILPMGVVIGVGKFILNFIRQ